MESFEPALKRPRGYDGALNQNSNGFPWTHGANPGANGAENGNGLPWTQPVNPGVNGLPAVPAESGCMPGFAGSTFGAPTGPSDNAEILGFQQGNGGELECRRYNTPDGCPYGSNCRFKHGPTDDRELGHQMLSSGAKTKPCMKFFSTSGCPYGEACHFLHYVPGGINALGVVPVPTVASIAMVPMRKQAGPVVDPSLTVNGYKTRLCNRFNTPEGCRFGDRCHFAHGESDLRPPNNIRSSSRTVATEVSMQALPIAYDTAPVMYDNGTSATYPNSTTYSDPTIYGNSTAYPNNTLTGSLCSGEPTPPGVTANPPFVANYGMPVENSTAPLMGIDAFMAGGPVMGSNVQVY